MSYQFDKGDWWKIISVYLPVQHPLHKKNYQSKLPDPWTWYGKVSSPIKCVNFASTAAGFDREARLAAPGEDKVATVIGAEWLIRFTTEPADTRSYLPSAAIGETHYKWPANKLVTQ